jgi:hypothetical protein
MFLENQIALHRGVAEWDASYVSGTRKGGVGDGSFNRSYQDSLSTRLRRSRT